MRIVALLLATALLQGCAFTDAKLDIAHPADATFKGPLSGANVTKFELKPLADERSDKARIGWKKNGYGQNTADITSSREVTLIVADAVTAGLQRNGHSVGVPSDVTIAGAVTRFWFEIDPNFFTVEFIGNIECDLQFVSARSGTIIHKGRYSGTFSKKTGGGLEATWTEVMNAAVGKLVEDIVFDPELIEALEARS